MGACVIIRVGERSKREKARAFFLPFFCPPLPALQLHLSLPLILPTSHRDKKRNSYFTTSLLLGTPPKPFSVIVDTGSTLTYVACAGCASSGDCGPRHSSRSGFDAAASATARRVTCGDAERCSCGSRQQCGCEAALGGSGNSGPDSLEASLEGNCTWSREYAEESSASGRLVTDVATLPLVGAGAASKTSAADDKKDAAARKKKGEKPTAPSLLYRRVPVTFGCTTRETGEIFQQVADGILGMGASSTGFPSQLAAAGALPQARESSGGGGKSSSSSSSSLPPLPTEDAPPPFSLCMGGPEGGGALLLGPWLPEKWVKVNGTVPSFSKSQGNNNKTASAAPPPLPRGKKPLVQTPLVPSPGHPYYYAVGLEAVSLNGRPLEGFDASVFREGHGAVLDSGTTFTYLPGPVYGSLERAVRAAARAAGLPVVPGAQQGSYGDLCWGGLEGGEDAVARHFPRLQLRFAAEEGAGGAAAAAAFGGKAAPSTSSSPASLSSSGPKEEPKRVLRRRRRRKRELLSSSSGEKAAPTTRALKQNAAADAARVAAANAAAVARAAAARQAVAAGLPSPSPATVAAQNAAEMARVTAANAAARGKRRRRLEQESDEKKTRDGKSAPSSPSSSPGETKEKGSSGSEKLPSTSSSSLGIKKSGDAGDIPVPAFSSSSSSSSSEANKKDKGDAAGASPPPSTPQRKPKLRRRPPLPAAELDLPPLNYLFAHVSSPGAYCLGEFFIKTFRGERRHEKGWTERKKNLNDLKKKKTPQHRNLLRRRQSRRRLPEDQQPGPLEGLPARRHHHAGRAGAVRRRACQRRLRRRGRVQGPGRGRGCGARGGERGRGDGQGSGSSGAALPRSHSGLLSSSFFSCCCFELKGDRRQVCGGRGNSVGGRFALFLVIVGDCARPLVGRCRRGRRGVLRAGRGASPQGVEGPPGGGRRVRAVR